MIYFSLKAELYFQNKVKEWEKVDAVTSRDMKCLTPEAIVELRHKKKIVFDIEHTESKVY